MYPRPDEGIEEEPGVRADHKVSLAVAAWLTLVALGLGALAYFAGTPGSAGHPPPRWPALEGAPLGPEVQGPRLLVFAHPRCACTRATLAEVERWLASGAASGVEVTLVFCAAGHPPPRVRSDDLVARARGLPGARVVLDLDGRLEAAFAVATSGHALLYDAAGALRFSGGSPTPGPTGARARGSGPWPRGWAARPGPGGPRCSAARCAPPAPAASTRGGPPSTVADARALWRRRPGGLRRAPRRAC